MSDNSNQLPQLAADLERLAAAFHTQAQQFVVLCANEGRHAPTVNGMLGIGARTAELLRSLHSLRVAARRIEHIASYNVKALHEQS